ncbi:MAG: energy transducer TonB [Flavobacterium sp.]|uniref:energy transducer TonB n=1 Tax=Flavobacterium sp. TaxID=239 RepID=UPI002FC9E3F0
MKNTLLIFFVIVFSFKMKAQTVEASTIIPTNEYLDLLATNLEIPEEISKKYQKSSIDITIILTITKDGSVFNPKIQNDSLNLESNLKKAVEKLPKWNPKTEDGIAVVSRKAFNLVIPIQQIIEEEPIAGQVYAKANPKDGLRGFYSNYAKNFNGSKFSNSKEIKMLATFIVEKDGSLTNIKIVESNEPSLNKEAIRVIESMSNWNPATENGKPIRSNFTLPITIKQRN